MNKKWRIASDPPWLFVLGFRRWACVNNCTSVHSLGNGVENLYRDMCLKQKKAHIGNKKKAV